MSGHPQDPPFPPIAEDLFCQKCGYNLRGLTGDACPECGRSLAGIRSAVCNIPWVHRRQLGWWRAYWKTVFVVMFRQRQFAEEMARPVSYRDSQSFRWLTVPLVMAPVIAADSFLWAAGVPSPTKDPWVEAAWSSITISVAFQLAFLLFVAGASGVPSYFFHPRAVSVQQQNRAIALSYYAGGPLAITFVPTVGYVFALALGPSTAAGAACAIVAVLVSLALFTVWWLDLIHLTRRLLPQRRSRAVVVGVFVPVLWACLLVVLVPGPLFLIGGLIVALRTL